MNTKNTVLIVGLLTISAPVAAGAQDNNPAARAQTEALLSDAADHRDAGRHALAAERYLAAYEVMHAANFRRASYPLYNAGNALRNVPGREQQARDLLQRFLDASTTLTDIAQVRDWRSGAVERIAELDARIRSGLRLGDHPSSDEREEQSSGGVSPIGPIVIGVGVAIAGVGGVMGALALVEESSLTDSCGGDICVDTPDNRRIHDSMFGFAIASDVLLIVGGIAVASGVVLTLTLEDDGGDEVSASATCSPWACGVLLQGGF